MSSGLDGLQDYEVIELLLHLGQDRKDMKEAAKAVLERFKNLPGVFEASENELREIKGIGPVNIFGLKLVKALADRYLRDKARGSTPLNNSRDLINYLTMKMRDRRIECFNVIYLDARNRILDMGILFKGSVSSSAVYPREVISESLKQKAVSLIFAHNHPSGDPSPSREDLSITRKLLFAARIMGITVHDHLIIGNPGYYSFADQGIIAELHREYEKMERS